MNREGLTHPVPEPHTAHCLRCRRLTAAPVPIGRDPVEYACPECAPVLTPGPIPDEVAAR
ncbi:hypothetical protein ACWF94_02975 [Streptomyces sp. NPDC055078]